MKSKSENEKRNRVSVKYGPDQEITVRKVTGHHRLPMARTITPRNAVLQYTQVARATPSFTPRTQFSCRPRRPAALTFTSTGPHSMSNTRHLASNRVGHRRVRRHTTARGRRRRDSRALLRGSRGQRWCRAGAVWMLLHLLLLLLLKWTA